MIRLCERRSGHELEATDCYVRFSSTVRKVKASPIMIKGCGHEGTEGTDRESEMSWKAQRTKKCPLADRFTK